MRRGQPQDGRTGPGSRPARLLTGAVLALYPASWRTRYGAEVRCLLAESGAGPLAIASLAWHAPAAWLWPGPHLHDRPARMRSSLVTVLAAWTMLTGLALVFVQLTQAQGIKPAGRPLIPAAYWILDAMLPLSALVVAAGGLPLWWLMLRRAVRGHRSHDLSWLLAPLLLPPAYLASVALTVRFIPHDHGVGPWWFLAFVTAGFAAGALAAAGPGVALCRIRPGGPAVELAMRAAGLATALSVLTALASVLAAAGLSRWAPDYAGYHQVWPVAGYAALAGLAAAVASVSAARGLRAAGR